MKKFLIAFILCIGMASVVSAEDIIKVGCIGDSITYGAGMDSPETEGYPAQLAQLLGDRYEVKNFGKSACSALKTAKYPYIETEEYKASLEYAPDIAVVMLGTNDIKTENWTDGQAWFREDYTDILDSYKEVNPDVRIYMILPTYIFSDTAYGERPVANLENGAIPVLREISSEGGYTLIDMFTPSKELPEFFPDFLHPNKEGCGMIARAVYEKIVRPAAKLDEVDANALLTRVQFIELLMQAFNYGESNMVFIDCKNPAVGAAYDIGIVIGVSDSAFEPDRNITRQEMSVFLKRVLDRAGYEFINARDISFIDLDSISDWAKEAAVKTVLLGLVDADDKFEPEGSVTYSVACNAVNKVINYYL